MEIFTRDIILTKIFIGLVIAVFSALITIILAFPKFRKEKIWEKRAEAYSSILGAIYDAGKYTSKHLVAELKECNISEEEEVILSETYRKAEQIISRAMYEGLFYLSDALIERLEKHKKELCNVASDRMWCTYLTESTEIYDKLRQDIVDIAKNDLKLIKI